MPCWPLAAGTQPPSCKQVGMHAIFSMRSEFPFLPAVNCVTCAGYAYAATGKRSSQAAEPAQRKSRAVHGPPHGVPALGPGRPWKRPGHGAGLRTCPPRARQGLCELRGRARQGEHAACRQPGAWPAADARLAAQRGPRPGRRRAVSGPRQRRIARAQSAQPPRARRPRRGRRGWAGGGAGPPGCAARRTGWRSLARRKCAP